MRATIAPSPPAATPVAMSLPRNFAASHARATALAALAAYPVTPVFLSFNTACVRKRAPMDPPAAPTASFNSSLPLNPPIEGLRRTRRYDLRIAFELNGFRRVRRRDAEFLLRVRRLRLFGFVIIRSSPPPIFRLRRREDRPDDFFFGLATRRIRGIVVKIVYCPRRVLNWA